MHGEFFIILGDDLYKVYPYGISQRVRFVLAIDNLVLRLLPTVHSGYFERCVYILKESGQFM